MAGKKIEQARKALKSVLNNLRDDDLFNIVVYDDRAESFKPELQRYGSARRARKPSGSSTTSARGAAPTSTRRSRRRWRWSRTPRGRATCSSSPTACRRPARRVSYRSPRTAAGQRAAGAVFCFGVGYDVNARLLDRLSGGNSGTSEYVKPDEDIETHVGRFYSKMTSPVLADIRLELAGIDVNRTYPRDLPDLFEGGQLVWAGRYRQSGRTTIRIDGQGRRRAPQPRVPGRAGRRRIGGSELRLRRTALGRTPAGRSHRPDRHARPEQRAGRRAGRAEHRSTASSRPIRRSWPTNGSSCMPVGANVERAQVAASRLGASRPARRRRPAGAQAGCDEGRAAPLGRGCASGLRTATTSGSRKPIALAFPR